MKSTHAVSLTGGGGVTVGRLGQGAASRRRAVCHNTIGVAAGRVGARVGRRRVALRARAIIARL